MKNRILVALLMGTAAILALPAGVAGPEPDATFSCSSWSLPVLASTCTVNGYILTPRPKIDIFWSSIFHGQVRAYVTSLLEPSQFWAKQCDVILQPGLSAKCIEWGNLQYEGPVELAGFSGPDTVGTWTVRATG